MLKLSYRLIVRRGKRAALLIILIDEEVLR
jgi:hypothetical protein